jgi:ribosomal protein S18 acetylase RimI-like enzyme
MIYSVLYDKNPKPENIDILSEGIANHAKLKKGYQPNDYFSFFIRDEANEIKAGCNGLMYYGCELYVDQLWVDEMLRGQGYGRQLMQSAENLGRCKRCLFATLTTMNWEALDFYKELGYQIEFERHGYTKRSVLYFLRKFF